MSRVGCAVLLASLAARPAAAQGLASALDEPTPEGDGGVVLHLTTYLGSDRATVVPESGGERRRCRVPCDLTLAPGRYRLDFERANEAAIIELVDQPILARAHPLDTAELGGGIGLAAAGALALVVLGVMAGEDEVCLRLDDTCDGGPGFAVLGTGGMAVLIGIGLAIDSIGSVEVLPIPRIRRSAE